MRTIVRRDTGEGYETFPQAEHAVDLETGTVVGLTVRGARAGHTATMVETLVAAAEQVGGVLPAGSGVAEVVGDKGHHSNETMVALRDLGLRGYVSGRIRPGLGMVRGFTNLDHPRYTAAIPPRAAILKP